MSLILFSRSLGKFADSSLDGMPRRLSGYTQDARSLQGIEWYGCTSSAAAHRLLYANYLLTRSAELSPTSFVAQYLEVG